jgi:hypothetical protein
MLLCRHRQRDFWIGAERHQPLFTAEPKLPAQKLPATRRYEQMEAPGVGEAIRLASRFRFADFGVCQSHQIYPQKNHHRGLSFMAGYETT